MELKERKKINNKLPGFESGTSNYVTGGINMNVNGGQLGYIQPSYNMSSVAHPSVPYNNPVNYNDAALNMLANGIRGNTLQPAIQLKNPSAGSAANAGPWFALGAWAGEGVGKALVNANKSADSFLSDAGISQGSIAGFGYQKQNSVNEAKELANYKKQTALSWLTNPFEGITRIFGRHNYEKLIRKANLKAERLNNYNRSEAMSDYLAQLYSNEYGNDDSQILWGAAKGKDKVETSIGRIPAKATAKVAKGEPIVDNIDDASSITGHVVRNGKRGVDTNLAGVNPSTVIFGGDVDIRDGKKFQDKTVLPTLILEQINKYERRSKNINGKLRGVLGRSTDEFQLKTMMPIKEKIASYLQDNANQLALLHQLLNYTGLINAKKGKDELPGFANGSNWWIDSLGVATGLGLLFSTAFQKVKKPNSYVRNPYASTALAGLAGLNINPYPMMQQMRDQERRNLYAINRAGGLSGAQKAFANIATGIGTQRNIADLGANIQALNNQYKTNYYSTMMNAGLADRQARMAANQHDLDYFSKAHAAKLQMAQMGIYDMLKSLQQGYVNAFSRKWSKKTYNLYAQDMALNKKKTDAEIANMKDEAAYNRRYLADLRKKGIIS